MPKRTDLKTILIIGAGPIIIGQACEFDYSGAQACKALREEGFKVILVNSNPATIMTDPETADVTYIEPITWQVVEKIIEKEKPDAILPTMGGQTALNCALDLHHHGVLDKHGVELIGASPAAIEKAEDRLKFKNAMSSIGLGSARSGIAHSLEEGWSVQKEVGFPVIIRPSFTLGGTGGGIAYNAEEFEEICKRGLELSPTSELLIEESLIGWKEFEMEVVRDRKDNCIPRMLMRGAWVGRPSRRRMLTFGSTPCSPCVRLAIGRFSSAWLVTWSTAPVRLPRRCVP